MEKIFNLISSNRTVKIYNFSQCSLKKENIEKMLGIAKDKNQTIDFKFSNKTLDFKLRLLVNYIKQPKNIDLDSKKIPEHAPKEYYCPITLNIMLDPVIISDGSTYEKTAIQRHLEKSTKSPLTNAILKNRELIPNSALKKLITDYINYKVSITGQLEVNSDILFPKLRKAIKENNHTELENIFEMTPKLVLQKIEDNKTALHLACETGNTMTLKIVLKHLRYSAHNFARQHDVILLFKLAANFYPNKNNHAQLIAKTFQWNEIEFIDVSKKALYDEDIPTLTACLQNIDINTPIENGGTLLHIAVRQKKMEVISHLIKSGAYTHSWNNSRKSPVDIAHEMQAQDVVQLLNKNDSLHYFSPQPSITDPNISQIQNENKQLQQQLDAQAKLIKKLQTQMKQLHSSSQTNEITNARQPANLPSSPRTTTRSTFNPNYSLYSSNRSNAVTESSTHSAFPKKAPNKK